MHNGNMSLSSGPLIQENENKTQVQKVLRWFEHCACFATGHFDLLSCV